MKREIMTFAFAGTFFFGLQSIHAENGNSDVQFTETIDEDMYQLSNLTSKVTEMGRLRSMDKGQETSNPVNWERRNLAELCADVKHRYNDDAMAQTMKFPNARFVAYLLPFSHEFSNHLDINPNDTAKNQAVLETLAPDQIPQCITLRKRVEEQGLNIAFSIRPEVKMGHPNGLEIKISWED